MSLRGEFWSGSPSWLLPHRRPQAWGPLCSPRLDSSPSPLWVLQVRYKEEFEKNKGKGFSVVADTPELQRIKKTQDQISNVSSPVPMVPR